jgi:hypothetical protein
MDNPTGDESVYPFFTPFMFQAGTVGPYDLLKMREWWPLEEALSWVPIRTSTWEVKAWTKAFFDKKIRATALYKTAVSAIMSGRIKARQDDGSYYVDPETFILWLSNDQDMLPVPMYLEHAIAVKNERQAAGAEDADNEADAAPAEIDALDVLSGTGDWNGLEQRSLHPALREATIRTDKDGSVVFGGVLRTGEHKERHFKPKDGQATNLQKGLQLLAYYHEGDDPRNLNNGDTPKGILASQFIREFIPSLPSTPQGAAAAIKRTADILGDIQKALNKAGFPSDVIPRINRAEARRDPSGFMQMRLRLNVPTLHRSEELSFVPNQNCIRQTHLADYDPEHDKTD